MRPEFIPESGRLAVVREFIDEVAAEVVEEGTGKVKQIVKPQGGLYSTDVDYQRRINPWALVVGKGPAKKLDDGSLYDIDVEPGEKVLIGEIGRFVELRTLDGEDMDYLYVLPFEGVLGRIQWKCEKNPKHVFRTEPKDGVCIKCPSIVAPTMQDAMLVEKTR